MKFLKPPPAAKTGQGGQSRCLSDELADRWPALTEYLTVTAWGDGRGRTTATLLLLWEEGAWKACLNDREGERALWRSSGTLTGLLDGLEATLIAEDGDWRRKVGRPRGR